MTRSVGVGGWMGGTREREGVNSATELFRTVACISQGFFFFFVTPGRDPTHGWTIARGRVAQNNRYYAALCRVVDLIQTETGAGSVRVRVGQTGRMDWPPMAATGVTALGSGVVCSEIKGGGGRKTRLLSVSHAEPCLPPFGCEGKRTGTALGEVCVYGKEGRG